MIKSEYNFAPISSRIDYWHKYWQNRIRVIISSEDIYSKIFTPRFLLENIISDIESFGTPKKSAWAMFQSEFCEWNRFEIFNTLYGRYCSFALKHWNDKPLLVESICYKILQRMNSGEFYYSAASKLSDVLTHIAGGEYVIAY